MLLLVLRFPGPGLISAASVYKHTTFPRSAYLFGIHERSLKSPQLEKLRQGKKPKQTKPPNPSLQISFTLYFQIWLRAKNEKNEHQQQLPALTEIELYSERDICFWFWYCCLSGPVSVTWMLNFLSFLFYAQCLKAQLFSRPIHDKWHRRDKTTRQLKERQCGQLWAVVIWSWVTLSFQQAMTRVRCSCFDAQCILNTLYKLSVLDS